MIAFFNRLSKEDYKIIKVIQMKINFSSRFMKFIGGRNLTFSVIHFILIGTSIYIYSKISFVFYFIMIYLSYNIFFFSYHNHHYFNSFIIYFYSISRLLFI